MTLQDYLVVAEGLVLIIIAGQLPIDGLLCGKWLKINLYEVTFGVLYLSLVKLLEVLSYVQLDDTAGDISFSNKVLAQVEYLAVQRYIK